MLIADTTRTRTPTPTPTLANVDTNSGSVFVSTALLMRHDPIRAITLSLIALPQIDTPQRNMYDKLRFGVELRTLDLVEALTR